MRLKIIAALAVIVLLGQGCQERRQSVQVTTNMRLTSTAFKQGQPIPSKYTCDGENINPPLDISGVPSSARSRALIMDDPDVPAAAGIKVWDHWVVFNMPVTLTSIAENEQPPGVRGQGTRGSLSYGGPCPPDREHRYFFKLYALDDVLSLKEGATKSEVERAMRGHIVAQAELMGTYVRK